MKIHTIIFLSVIPMLSNAQEHLTYEANTIWTFTDSQKSYFCSTTPPSALASGNLIRVENMSSVSLNRQVACYKCCVGDLSKEICSKTPYENYGSAKSGKDCGCKSI